MSKFIRKIALLFMVFGMAVSVVFGTDYYEDWSNKDDRNYKPKCSGYIRECLEKSWEQFKVEYKPYYDACVFEDTYEGKPYFVVKADKKVPIIIRGFAVH